MEKLRNNCRAKEIHKNDNVGYKSTKKIVFRVLFLMDTPVPAN